MNEASYLFDRPTIFGMDHLPCGARPVTLAHFRGMVARRGLEVDDATSKRAYLNIPLDASLADAARAIDNLEQAVIARAQMEREHARRRTDGHRRGSSLPQPVMERRANGEEELELPI